MAVRDLEAFLRQSAATYDANIDVSPGAPFDSKVIQPLVRRLGIDPFTVDLSTFLTERLRQAYPQLALDEGDNLTDLLVKPLTLLWDPLVREVTRVNRSRSLADPSTLTLDEADALGGNLFTPRRRGEYARGTARLFFAKPQDVKITPNNFVTSRGGLVFYPRSMQSIRSNEMLLNVTQDNLYYFDVTLIAERPGAAYRIDKGELYAIANLNAAIRVTNLARFTNGEDEEDVYAYVSRIEQSLGEKSMVSLRGISAKIFEAFPEVNRLNVIGYNDPEMQRDLITGGGLGPVLASGSTGVAIDDAEGSIYTRRFHTDEADFGALVGADAGFVLTVFGATTDDELAQDFAVSSLYDQTTIDLADQRMVIGRSGLCWTLRKNELTISNIPGGILFPNTAHGDLRIDSGSVHVGGAFDVYTRSTDFEEVTITIGPISDDSPVLSGMEALSSTLLGKGGFLLEDYGVGPHGESLLSVLLQAAFEGYAFSVLDGPNAGTYRVLGRLLTGTNHLFLHTDPEPANADPVTRRWKLSDAINVDLVEPKDTLISDEDLITVQGSSLVKTDSGTNFNMFGVATGDTLRIHTGASAGDYTITAAPLAPSYDQLQVDRQMPFSTSEADYTVFRSSGSGVNRPLISIKHVELLDSSSQPQGSYVPYAKPVDVQSRAFQNSARGVKHDFRNASLGLVSTSADQSLKTFTIDVSTTTLTVYIGSLVPPERTIVLTPGTYTVDTLVDHINVLLLSATGYAAMASRINDYYFGLRPVGTGYVAVIGGTARLPLFGSTALRTTADITANEVPYTSWNALKPSIDFETGLDTAQVVDGRNIGFFGGPFIYDASHSGATSEALIPGRTLIDVQQGNGLAYFSPDVGRRVLIGTRSLGSVRVFFLEPTTFEVNGGTVFELDSGTSGILRFIPDPTLRYQQIPPLPDGTTPNDGTSTGGATVFTSASQDFLLCANVGDELVVENHPLLGSVTLPDPIPGLAGTTFIYSINNGPDRTLVFIRDDASLSPGEVRRQGMIEQINASCGVAIASLLTDRLNIATDLNIVIRASGTALPIILGNVTGYTPTRAFSSEDTSNESPHAGTYRVVDVGVTTLEVTPAFPVSANWPASIADQTFRLLKVGVQRICTTQMAQQQAEASLYYADVELISEGSGDAWNIDSGEQLTVSGYQSDGYYLLTEDDNLTFSPLERPSIVISRTILEDGVDDDPRNATQITGQTVQIAYTRSSVIQSVQDFAMSDIERVVCSSPLSRHLVPHFVRYDFEYFGGSTSDIVLEDHLNYIRKLPPVDSLDSSDLQRLATDRGATRVTNPVTLLAVVHDVDRSVQVRRSQDRLSTGRLSAFIPDIINVVRRS